MNAELVTVIVPVYNIAAYLGDCADSLLRQTYGNLEILLVDDGSTDGSGELADQLAARDARIRVLHKPNGGLSSARNHGVRHAQGALLTFVDGDDIVSPRYVEHLATAMNMTGAPMSVTMLRSFTDGERPDISEQTKTGGNTPIVMSASSILEDMLCMRRVESSAYTKLYQRDLFDGIEYPDGKLYEDIAVTAKLFDRAGHVAVMDQRDYWYRQRKGSIQNSGFGPRQLDLLGQLDEVRRLVETNYPDLMPAWQSKLQSALFNLYMKIPSAQAGKATGRRLWTMIRTNRMAVIRNRGARLDARLASLLSYFGPDVCRFAYRLSYLRRKAL